MHRKDWMPPRREAIGRNLPMSQLTGRTAEGRRKTKRAMALLACATALTLLAASVLLSVGDGNETAEPEVPARDLAPPAPFIVFGYTYEADGTTPLGECAVNITDVTSGLYWELQSSSTGQYYISIEAAEGDEIHVIAVKDLLYGENTGIASGGSIMLSIVVQYEIPEFPMVLAPVLGTLALFTVVVFRRRRKVQP